MSAAVKLESDVPICRNVAVSGSESPLRGWRETEHSSLAWRTLFSTSVRFDTEAEKECLTSLLKVSDAAWHQTLLWKVSNCAQVAARSRNSWGVESWTRPGAFRPCQGWHRCDFSSICMDPFGGTPTGTLSPFPPLKYSYRQRVLSATLCNQYWFNDNGGALAGQCRVAERWVFNK